MKHCSVWSEPECNSGVRLAELPNVLPGSSFSESITGDRGTCTILLSINDRAVQLGYVAIYNVIRIVDDDDTVYEYRIQGLDDEAGTKSVRVTGSSLITDLGRVLIYQVAGGTTTFDFAVSDQSMASYITNYVLPAMTANGMGLIERASVKSFSAASSSRKYNLASARIRRAAGSLGETSKAALARNSASSQLKSLIADWPSATRASVARGLIARAAFSSGVPCALLYFSSSNCPANW